jgi:hypothetical protein
MLKVDLWEDSTSYHLLSTCDFHDSMSAAVTSLHMRVVANIMMIIVTTHLWRLWRVSSAE